MAVFKPTNCSPYLTAFDITYLDEGPIYFQCKIDTSNTKIDGYAITIYDNDNKQVFPFDKNSINNMSYIKDLNTDTNRIDTPIKTNGVSDLNTGLNGTYLKIPFVVKQNDFDGFTDTTKNNIVYYDSANLIVKDKLGNTIELTNGHQYKWSITLYQLGENAVAANMYRPEDDKYYDMTVATGKILGSTNERIQSYPSEEIYNDYFIQLYNKKDGVELDGEYKIANEIEDGDNVTQVGTRVRVKDYDSYLGHIYPQIGQDGFSKGEIDQANLLKIFKMSNDPDDLGVKDKVDFCVTKDYYIPKYFHDSESNSQAAYLLQIFYICPSGNTDEEKIDSIKQIYNKPFGFCLKTVTTSDNKTFYGYKIDPNAPITGPIVNFDSSRIVLNTETNTNEIDENDGHIINSRTDNIISTASYYNGIWIPKTPTIDSKKTITVEGNVYWKVSIQWYRSSDADTWGELTNKIVLDTKNSESNWDEFVGKNIQAYPNEQSGQQVTTGTINATSVEFNLEKAIEIYPKDKEKYYAPIYKNNMKFSGSDENISIAFIGPSTAISIGDKIFNSENKSSEIKGLNTTIWAIQYNKKDDYGQDIEFDISNSYSIKTFFRSSSENQFSLYSRPTVTITLKSASGGIDPIQDPSDSNRYLIGERSIIGVANYEQTDLIQWRNYQWFLYDGDYSAGNKDLNVSDIILQSQVGYDKEIKYTFYGLAEDNHDYTIVLVLTDQYGTIVTVRQLIHTNFNNGQGIQLVTEDEWANYGLRCDLTGVDIWFTDKSGYIFPNLQDRNYLLTENNYANNPYGVTYDIQNSVMNINDDSSGVLYDCVYGNLGTSAYNPPSKHDLEFDEEKGFSFKTQIQINTNQYDSELLNVVIDGSDKFSSKTLSVIMKSIYYEGDLPIPDGIIGGFPTTTDGIQKVINGEKLQLHSFFNDSVNERVFTTTDLWPDSYQLHLQKYTAYIPTNVVSYGINIPEVDSKLWYTIDYSFNGGKTLISDQPMLLLNETELAKRDVVYDFPLYTKNKYNNKRTNDKTDYPISENAKTYSVWQDTNEKIVIPTFVKMQTDDGTARMIVWRLVNNFQEDIEDVYWEDTYTDSDGNEKDYYWDDGNDPEFTELVNIRNEDGTLITRRNYLNGKVCTLNVNYQGGDNNIDVTMTIDDTMDETPKEGS